MSYPASPEVIEADYFQWLCGLVMIDEPDHSYWVLAKELHVRRFVWTIPNDDNRNKDGEKLREIFADESFYDNCDCLRGPASVLEVLIGIAKRMESILYDPKMGDRTVNWFWELIENLGLQRFTDEEYYLNGGPILVDQILSIWMHRSYKKTGVGGIFPLKNAKKDQKKVEIWYQMHAYLAENYSIEP